MKYIRLSPQQMEVKKFLESIGHKYVFSNSFSIIEKAIDDYTTDVKYKCKCGRIYKNSISFLLSRKLMFRWQPLVACFCDLQCFYYFSHKNNKNKKGLTEIAHISSIMKMMNQKNKTTNYHWLTSKKPEKEKGERKSNTK